MGWSTQVAGEFFSVAKSSKRQFQLSTNKAAEFVKVWLNFPTAVIGSSTVLRAFEIQTRFQVNYWDATIIAAARELGCQTIYTEDLAHGQDYDGVRVVNPFL